MRQNLFFALRTSACISANISYFARHNRHSAGESVSVLIITKWSVIYMVCNKIYEYGFAFRVLILASWAKASMHATRHNSEQDFASVGQLSCSLGPRVEIRNFCGEYAASSFLAHQSIVCAYFWQCVLINKAMSFFPRLYVCIGCHQRRFSL